MQESNINLTKHIKYLWWVWWKVQCKNWTIEELSGVAGSCYVLKIWWKKILVDLWMNQWWRFADALNNKDFSFLQDIDAVLITHAHIDHIWLLPYLHKAWFKGKIFMSQATRDIGKYMLEDSYSIAHKNSHGERKLREKLLRVVPKCFRILEIISQLWKKIDSTTRNKLESELGNLVDSSQDKRNITLEIQKFLRTLWISQLDELENTLGSLWKLPYDISDINWVIDMVEVIEPYEEKIIFSQGMTIRNWNHPYYQELIELPGNEVEAKNYSLTSTDIKQLRDIWVWNLEWQIQIVLSDEGLRNEINAKREEFRKELETLASSVFHVKQNLDKWGIGFKDSLTSSRREFDLANEKRFLESIWINEYADVQRVISGFDESFFIDKYRIGIPFNERDIKDTARYLSRNTVKIPTRECISLFMSPTAHVAGAMWFTVNSFSGKFQKWKKELKKIQMDVSNRSWKILDFDNKEVHSVRFSWDLWRTHENRLWPVELPERPVDYLQLECTYGWKEHREREESVDDLVDNIRKSKWDILIAAFSQQRMQEMCLTLLEWLWTWEILDYDIYLDSVLWEKVTKYCVKHFPDIYGDLSEKSQEEKFGRVIFHFLWEDEYKDIYKTHEDSEESWKKRKKIVIASSWMMQWWAIVNHLRYYLKNAFATILAPGFLAKWTPGYHIVHWSKNNDKEHTVKLLWELYRQFCQAEQIDGFSSHIWWDELIEYVYRCLKQGKLKLWATTALVHWDVSSRLALKSDLEYIFSLEEPVRDDIRIILPDMSDEYDLNSWILKQWWVIHEQDLSKKQLSKIALPSCLKDPLDSSNQWKKRESKEDKTRKNDLIWQIEKNEKSLNKALWQLRGYFHNQLLWILQKKLWSMDENPLSDYIDLDSDHKEQFQDLLAARAQDHKNWKKELVSCIQDIQSLEVQKRFIESDFSDCYDSELLEYNEIQKEIEDWELEKEELLAEIAEETDSTSLRRKNTRIRNIGREIQKKSDLLFKSIFTSNKEWNNRIATLQWELEKGILKSKEIEREIGKLWKKDVKRKDLQQKLARRQEKNKQNAQSLKRIEWNTPREEFLRKNLPCFEALKQSDIERLFDKDKRKRTRAIWSLLKRITVLVRESEAQRLNLDNKLRSDISMEVWDEENEKILLSLSDFRRRYLELLNDLFQDDYVKVLEDKLNTHQAIWSIDRIDRFISKNFNLSRLEWVQWEVQKYEYLTDEVHECISNVHEYLTTDDIDVDSLSSHQYHLETALKKIKGYYK